MPRVGAAPADITLVKFSSSINLKITPQRSYIQFTLRTSATIQDVDSAFSPDQSVLNLFSAVAVLPQTEVPPAPPPNRRFGHQNTNRLAISSLMSKLCRSA